MFPPILKLILHWSLSKYTVGYYKFLATLDYNNFDLCNNVSSFFQTIPC